MQYQTWGRFTARFGPTLCAIFIPPFVFYIFYFLICMYGPDCAPKSRNWLGQRRRMIGRRKPRATLPSACMADDGCCARAANAWQLRHKADGVAEGEWKDEGCRSRYVMVQ